jgi:hypothetical protein
MFWQIASFPKCEHHVFLSHCREDSAGLVRPVYDRLTAAGVVPWLDQEDYYYGRDSRSALRDGLLRSRHVVFFVTEAMLTTARGWSVFELAFTEVLELNFQVTGGQLAHLLLPLFLVPQTHPDLPRTVWQAVRDRGRFHNPDADGDAVQWCDRVVREFISHEQQLAKNMAEATRVDAAFAARLKAVPGLFDRVTKFHPRRHRTTT